MAQGLDRRGLLGAGLTLGLAVPALAATPKTPTRPAPKVLAAPKPSPIHFNVRDFGAVGDGLTKDTLAFQQAMDRAAVLGGGEVRVPAATYVIGSIFIGSGVHLVLEDGAELLGSPDVGDYPLGQVRWEGRFRKGYNALICARDADDWSLTGKGKIVGSPVFRVRVEQGSGFRNPTLIEFINCKNVTLSDLDTEQSAMWSIHPVFCENVTFKGMTINGGADGLDIDSCKHVIVDNCSFNTGDDSISLKSGRGMEGYTLARICEDVHITNCTFTDRGFANIGIGSEASGGIRNAVIENCKFIGARSYAIYIKTKVGRGAFIEDIIVRNCDVSGMQAGFLHIDNITVGNQDEFPVQGDAGIPQLGNFVFDNIRVVDVPALVVAPNIHPAKPMNGLTLSNISGTCRKGVTLTNTRNANFKDIKVTGYAGALLNLDKVTGTGLAGAVPTAQPTLPAPITPPAKPYVLGDLKPIA